MQGLAERTDIAKARVGDDGGQVDPRRAGPAQQGQGEAPLLLKVHRQGNPRARAAGRIARPVFRHIQRHAERPRALPRPQHGGDGHLAIGHLADGAAILPRHPDRVLALFEPAGVVDDQHAPPHRQEPQQRAPDGRHVPDRVRDEVLQRLIMARIGDAREHRLHGFPATVAQHALHIPPQRQRLRLMMETVVKLLQPSVQATNARPRRRVEHCAAA